MSKDFKENNNIKLISYMADENNDTKQEFVLNKRNSLKSQEQNETPDVVMNKNHQGSCANCAKKNNDFLNVNDAWVILDLPPDHVKKRNKKPFQKLKNFCRQKCKNFFTKKTLYRRIPITYYLPRYNLETAISDIVAGLTVGLTIIPQAIAYASVAGLPAQIGLYSSFVAPFLYAVFGSSKDSPVGPTAIEALLTKENIHGMGIPGTVLLCFLSGCVMCTMGILNLGFLIDFISGPVAIGFTSGAAIVIGTTQVKELLGLQYPGDKFVLVWTQIYHHIGETSVPDVSMGMVCITALLVLNKIKYVNIIPEDRDPEKVTIFHKGLKNTLWLLSTSRNLLVVVLSAVTAYWFEMRGKQPFQLTGYVKPGLPPVSPPPFQTTVGNETYNFGKMVTTLGSGIIILPILSVLQNYAIAKVYSDGRAIDSTQEMLALGICNIVSSFVSSMPVSGALSRGAVNHASGVKTTFGGVYTATMVVLALSFLTPWFYYIPKSSLAAVIIVAVAQMIELHVIGPIWKTKKIDLIPATVTFFACLFTRLEIGIFAGVTLNILFLLYATARPKVAVEKLVSPSGCQYLLVTPDRSLAFPSVEYVRSVISKAGSKQGHSYLPVVVDAKHIQGADFTAAKGMKILMRDFNARNQPIIFINLKRRVVDTFQGVNPKTFLFCGSEAELDETLRDLCTEDYKTKF